MAQEQGSNHRKLKCAACDRELLSKAKKPRCWYCGSRRFNPISQFSAPLRKQEANIMAKKDENTPAPTEVKKKSWLEDLDDDLNGGDDDEDD